MLVLSRQPGQRLIFPGLNIRVEVVKVSGQLVRLGIDAPANIKILREELAPTDAAPSSLVRISPEREWVHAFRVKLNNALMSLYVAERYLQQGDSSRADELMQQGIVMLQELESMNGGQPQVKRHCRALLVEDNKNEEALLANYLRMCGIGVESVNDGQQAIDFLHQHELPDVMLIDMHMPHIDGPRTVEIIRNNPAWKSLKMFAVTGCKRTEYPQLAVDHWFQKPLNPVHLVNALQSIVV
ncbi:MAG TPA: carbon storage regulator [Gemmatales bacterium]|nr:carbon storage regulator [Gemmatales bacterium]HMP16263.1 carbon storage regulator [Gemmatales bacterium]